MPFALKWAWEEYKEGCRERRGQKGICKEAARVEGRLHGLCVLPQSGSARIRAVAGSA
jgi:hypothetical protein